MILVPGCAGFICSNFVLHWLVRTDEPVFDLEKLTYAGNSANLTSVDCEPHHELVVGDISDREVVGTTWRSTARARC